jgi:hypothetical protein
LDTLHLKQQASSFLAVLLSTKLCSWQLVMLSTKADTGAVGLHQKTSWLQHRYSAYAMLAHTCMQTLVVESDHQHKSASKPSGWQAMEPLPQQPLLQGRGNNSRKVRLEGC